MLMLTDKYHQYKTIDTIDENSQFGQEIEYDSGSVSDILLYDMACEMIACGAKINISDYLNKYRCKTGATKAVIICEDSPVVLKIPFNGVWYSAEVEALNEDEEDNFIEEYSEESYFDYFACADVETGLRDSDSNWNYCETELIIYENAVEDGFGDCFAKVERYGTTPGGYPLYIQERCQFTNPEKFSKASMESFLTLDKESKGLFCSSVWGCAFIERYGEKRLEALNAYIKEKRLSDLHDGNLGYRACDGAPVITDSSGFFD